jgi:flagellar M-ring protein FliF
MKPDLKSFLDQLAKAPLQTKFASAVVALAVVAAIAIGGWISARPHFVKLYANLGDFERVAVEKALAEAKVAYRVSDFPGPFVIYVDESHFDEAQISVALAGALAKAPRGIDASQNGTASIFMSSSERSQSMQKREWQECEHLLEQLDFVAAATVTTSMPETSPLKPKKPVMVSVALGLRGASSLSSEQAANVAMLVRYRFGVPPENVVISDQAGHLLYDPKTGEDNGQSSRDLIEHAAAFERELAAKVNAQIENTFGPRKALVTVTSQWNYDQTTTVDEKIDPETVAMSSETKSTSTPAGTSNEVGGAAGVASNVANDFGNGNAAVPKEPAAPTSEALATTEDAKTVYEASRSKVQTVHSAPKLERLFVSLVLDESLSAKREELRAIVEAAVGFDKERKDVLGISTTTFAAEPATPPAEGAAKPDAGPSTAMRYWIERGVEIVAALGFVALLFVSLKPRRAGASAAAASSSAESSSPSIDPEALARAQIDELIKSDPRRVGEVLSRWAEEGAAARAGR